MLFAFDCEVGGIDSTVRGSNSTVNKFDYKVRASNIYQDDKHYKYLLSYRLFKDISFREDL